VKSTIFLFSTVKDKGCKEDGKVLGAGRVFLSALNLGASEYPV
jgi:hypothetical protein